jgi:hypothetical protein
MGFGDKKTTGLTIDPGTIDPAIKKRLRDAAGDKGLPCAVAMTLAQDLAVTPELIGRYADALNVRLLKCQLGLFGYSPKKKIVSATPPESEDIETAISEAAADNRLSCRAAWDIADRLNLRKMTVSAACEALAVKITACQLGAF